MASQKNCLQPKNFQAIDSFLLPYSVQILTDAFIVAISLPEAYHREQLPLCFILNFY